TDVDGDRGRMSLLRGETIGSMIGVISGDDVDAIVPEFCFEM
ncbi:hypothetical protein Tco_1147298, partial [Tanacetum coccineum]